MLIALLILMICSKLQFAPAGPLGWWLDLPHVMDSRDRRKIWVISDVTKRRRENDEIFKHKIMLSYIN